tara:strand:- start:2044 stop:3135 length:1092 start_codon:yes stop_codon:yes gene_type:complete
MLKNFIIFTVVLLLSYVFNNWPNSFSRNENKNADIFFSFMIITVLAALTTLQKLDKDEILSRNQTNEWKGFMQISFLLYHYYRATYVYNGIRVFVSSYVWMSGFGNYLYFTRKNDFSFSRIVSTMIRINILTVGLILVNKTPIMLYYVVPLHTMAFFLVYATCWFSQRERALLLSGLFLVLLFEFIKPPWGHEIEFRFGLDKYSAWWGMVCAYGYKEIKHDWKSGAVGFFMLLVWLIGQYQMEDKYAYNRWHPYVSIVPIVGYLLIRNCHPILRKTHSKAMAWVGQITLETYVLQFHLFMCHNVQDIIVIIPGYRVVNCLLVGTVFVGISWIARDATISLQKYMASRFVKYQILSQTDKMLSI